MKRNVDSFFINDKGIYLLDLILVDADIRGTGRVLTIIKRIMNPRLQCAIKLNNFLS